LEANTEAKVGWNLLSALLGQDELSCRLIGLTNLVTRSQIGYQDFEGLESYLVCLLLGIVWVDQESSARHGRHVTVLGAQIDVDYLRVKLFISAVDLKLVHGEVASRLD
jgi:hypothetical protein